MTESDIDTGKTKANVENDIPSGSIVKKDDKMDSVTSMALSSWRRCCFISMMPFSVYSGFIGLVMISVPAYLASQVTTIEKAFGLRSTESGLLVSMNDAGFVISVLFISYFGRNSHIPRILGVCSFLVGISTLICIIPHLFTDNSLATPSMNVSTNMTSKSDNQLCSVGLPLEPAACSEDQENLASASKTAAMAFITSGMFLQGLASSSRNPLTNTYVDDNVPSVKSGFYIGIILSLSVFGPALSYGIGGAVSTIYVTLDETDITLRDPRWVGAWWLGFLVFGTLAVLLSFPVCLFPKKLTNIQRDEHANSVQKPTKETISLTFVVSAIKGIFPALKRLATNAVYVSFVIGSALRFFALAGVLAFMPKYIQVHYGLSIFKSNIIFGVLGIGVAATGIFVGGIITRKFQLELKGLLKLLIIAQAIASAIGLVGMFLVCPQPEIQGFDINSKSNFLRAVSAENLTSCSAGCNCGNAKFFPVCGSNGVGYFSPCHAGCQGKTAEGYTDCLCISNITGGLSSPSVDATPGMCSSECSLYIVFTVLQVVGSFIGGLSTMPAALITLRSVGSRDKSFAVGVTFFCNSLLGMFLAPIVMGSVIDSTCRLRNTSCSGEEGSCAVYDIIDFRLKFHGTDAGISLGYITCFVISYMFLVRGSKGKLYVTESKESDREMEVKPPL